ncbi:MAG: hypothetical protein HEEMFOPI_01472 [Holosporales bacterium]
MDILTQGILGSATAIAVSSKTIGIRKSIVYGFILGIIPDLDLFFSLFIKHPWLVHRGISHSLFFAPFIACCTVLWRRLYSKGLYQEWFFLVFWALLTHPLLDLFTTNKTPLLMPFSDHRFALSAVSVIDLNYSLPLFLSVIFCWFIKSSNKVIWLNTISIFFTSIYLFTGIVMQEQAVKVIDQERQSKKSLKNLKCMVGADLFFIGNRYAVCHDEKNLYETYFSLSLSLEKKLETLTWNKVPIEMHLSTSKRVDNRIKNLIKKYINS